MLSQKNNTTFFIIICLIISWACSKGNSRDNDREFPVIKIVSPVNNQIFFGGQIVSIEAPLSDNKMIREFYVDIYNNRTNQFLSSFGQILAFSHYTISTYFIAETGIQYNIQIRVKDNSGNESRDSVLITTN